MVLYTTETFCILIIIYDINSYHASAIYTSYPYATSIVSPLCTHYIPIVPIKHSLYTHYILYTNKNQIILGGPHCRRCPSSIGSRCCATEMQIGHRAYAVPGGPRMSRIPPQGWGLSTDAGDHRSEKNESEVSLCGSQVTNPPKELELVVNLCVIHASWIQGMQAVAKQGWQGEWVRWSQHFCHAR